MKGVRRAFPLAVGVVLCALAQALVPAPANSRDVNALMTAAFGSTEHPEPVIAESLRRAAIDLTPEQRVYARGSSEALNLEQVIAQVDATVLIGLSTVYGAFTEPIVREMARKTARPIIFPLSNPTGKSEATAQDLMRWTDGRALIATGSPFAPVEFDGRLIPIAQCNNVYIFPAIGLAVVAAKATRITDTMLLAAARELGKHSPAISDASAPLLPRLEDIRGVAAEIAYAVARQAQDGGVAPQTSEDDLRDHIADTQWIPQYSSFMEF